MELSLFVLFLVFLRFLVCFMWGGRNCCRDIDEFSLTGHDGNINDDQFILGGPSIEIKRSNISSMASQFTHYSELRQKSKMADGNDRIFKGQHSQMKNPIIIPSINPSVNSSVNKSLGFADSLGQREKSSVLQNLRSMPSHNQSLGKQPPLSVNGEICVQAYNLVFRFQ